MKTGKIRKTEWLLLGLTGLFLCVLLLLAHRDRMQLKAAAVITEVEVPQEEILPDLSPLDLNTATVEELMTLPGIGEELAARIVAYRESIGQFESVEELMNVSGIGEGKFAGLEGRVSVNSEDIA